MRTWCSAAALSLALTACATVSTQQEVQMGASYASQINAKLPIIKDAELNRYLSQLGDSIAKLSDERDLDWHFYMVDSKEVNAFAVPGGYVYVNRGLVERAPRMDELAGVLGHEIGHVIHRHSVKLMEKEQAANMGVALGCILTGACKSQAAGAAINVAGSIVFAKFSRQDEQQADESAVTYVTRAGIDPRGLVTMFQTLLAERKSSPTVVNSWFATHPLEESRIASVNALIKRIDPAILATLTQDTPAYQAFRSRVLALPPPPPPDTTK